MCSIGEGKAGFYSLIVEAERVTGGDGEGGSASCETARREWRARPGIMAMLWDEVAQAEMLCIGLATCTSVQVVMADGGVRGVVD